jgi:hypothetical protein
MVGFRTGGQGKYRRGGKKRIHGGTSASGVTKWPGCVTRPATIRFAARSLPNP